MKITIEIKTGNQAFEYDRNREIAELMRKLSERMVRYDFEAGDYEAFDSNGARSAKATIEEN